MLTVKGLWKTFNPGTPDSVPALCGMDVEVAEGCFVVVIGTNGSGKSTLLNAIAGAFELDSGSVEIDGVDVSRLPEHRRAPCIGRVFQNPFAGTAPRMSIAENLALAAIRGRSRGLRWALGRSRRAALRDAVRELNLGLEDRMDSEIGALSGGQRQALTLLMATLVRPKLLLLDEHTAALDPKAADQIARLTGDWVARHRLTTLMVTHSMQQAVNLGDRLLMLHKGRVIHDFQGEDKRRLASRDLLNKFGEIRRMEQLDPAVADLLRADYV